MFVVILRLPYMFLECPTCSWLFTDCHSLDILIFFKYVSRCTQSFAYFLKVSYIFVDSQRLSDCSLIFVKKKDSRIVHGFLKNIKLIDLRMWQRAKLHRFRNAKAATNRNTCQWKSSRWTYGECRGLTKFYLSHRRHCLWRPLMSAYSSHRPRAKMWFPSCSASGATANGHARPYGFPLTRIALRRRCWGKCGRWWRRCRICSTIFLCQICSRWNRAFRSPLVPYLYQWNNTAFRHCKSYWT